MTHEMGDLKTTNESKVICQQLIEAMSLPHTSNSIMGRLLTALHDRDDFPVFRPYLGLEKGWGCVMASDFQRHMAASMAHWKAQIPLLGCQDNAIVGLWITGQKYEDLLNILGLVVAGYVPQIFGHAFPNPQVIRDLLSRSGATVLIFDETFTSQLECFKEVSPAFVPSVDSESPPNLSISDVRPVLPTDTAILIHSSGTTSGMPKLIPVSHGSLVLFVTEQYGAMLLQGTFEGQDISNTLGSFAQLGSLGGFLGSAYHGGCKFQSTSMAMSTKELVAMIESCGLNRLSFYGTSVSLHIRAAQNDPNVLKVLQNLRSINYTGVAVPKGDEEWAHDNNIPCVSIYGSSETSPVMSTVLGKDPTNRFFRFLPGVIAQKLVPFRKAASEEDEDSSQRDLLEMVSIPGCIDSPHASLFGEDGLYHSGDLFEEVQKGFYVFRGRTGDFVKTAAGLCDAKMIEDSIREACGDILYDVVLLGENRPLPCLFVEALPSLEGDQEHVRLAAEIVTRMSTFNEKLMLHERIIDPKRIHILDKGSLPRTKEKGNIRRNLTAEIYSKELDGIYA